MSKFIILGSFANFIVPYIILYSLYIQFSGESSPGGGFQAGVIFASAFIGLDLVKGGKKEFFSLDNLLSTGSFGVFLYGSVGLFSFFRGDKYLNYYSLAEDPLKAQYIGIFVVEAGVGLTVSAIMLLIYFLLRSKCES